MNLITGIVIKGNQYGRKIGFPTANLIVKGLEIEAGVWATRVLYSKKWHDAISYYSQNSNNEWVFESHFFDFDKDIYRESISIDIIEFLRSPIQFDSEELLIEQMNKDCVKVKRFLEQQKYPN